MTVGFATCALIAAFYRASHERVALFGSPTNSQKDDLHKSNFLKQAHLTMYNCMPINGYSRPMRDDDTFSALMREDHHIHTILSTETEGSISNMDVGPTNVVGESDGHPRVCETRQDDSEPSVAFSSLRDSSSSRESDDIGFEMEIGKNMLVISKDQDVGESLEFPLSLDAYYKDAVGSPSNKMEKPIDRRQRVRNMGRTHLGTKSIQLPSTKGEGRGPIEETVPTPIAAVAEISTQTTFTSDDEKLEKEDLQPTGEQVQVGNFKIQALQNLSHIGSETREIKREQIQNGNVPKDNSGSADVKVTPLQNDKEKTVEKKKQSDSETSWDNPLKESRSMTLVPSPRNLDHKVVVRSASSFPPSIVSKEENSSDSNGSLGSVSETINSSELDQRLDQIREVVLKEGNGSVSTALESVDGRWERLRDKLLNETFAQDTKHPITNTSNLISDSRKETDSATGNSDPSPSVSEDSEQINDKLADESITEANDKQPLSQETTEQQGNDKIANRVAEESAQQSSTRGTSEQGKDHSNTSDETSEFESHKLKQASREEMESALLSTIIVSRYSTTWTEGSLPSRRRRGITRVLSYEQSPSLTISHSRSPTQYSKSTTSAKSLPLFGLSIKENETREVGLRPRLAGDLPMVDATTSTRTDATPTLKEESTHSIEEREGKPESSENRSNSIKKHDKVRDTNRPSCIEESSVSISVSPITVEGEERQAPDNGSSVVDGILDDGLSKHTTIDDILLLSSGGTDGTDAQDDRSTPVPMLGNALSSLSESCTSNQRPVEKGEKPKLPNLRNSVTNSTVPEEDSHTLTPTSAKTQNQKVEAGQTDECSHGPKIEVTLWPSSSTSGKSDRNSSVEPVENFDVTPTTQDADAKTSVEEPTMIDRDSSKTRPGLDKCVSPTNAFHYGASLIDGDSTDSESSCSNQVESNTEKSVDGTSITNEVPSSQDVPDFSEEKSPEAPSSPIASDLSENKLPKTRSSPIAPVLSEDKSQSVSGFTKSPAAPSPAIANTVIGSFDDSHRPTMEEIPSWRLDLNLSDWTIEVERIQSGEVDVYRVHRHVLGVGPRRSKFLADVFGSNEELRSNRLRMEDTSAECFPLLLDFVYSQKKEIEVTSKNAIPLRHLAKTLRVESLGSKVAKFVREDLSLSNMSIYITKAWAYEDEKVLKLVTDTCAEKLNKIEVSHPMWAVMEPRLFLQVLNSPLVVDRIGTSPHLSLLIAEYYSQHKYDIKAETFKELTKEEIMPVIDPKAALPLVEISHEYGIIEHFSDLQKRCTDVLAYHWTVTSGADRGRLFAVLRGLPSHFTVDFLELVEGRKSSTLATPLGRFKKQDKQNTVVEADGDTLQGNEDSANLMFTDSTEDDEDDSQESCLTWRLDPETSFSDWKVEIKSLQNGSIDTYHVHKRVLALGPCRSHFFSREFQKQRQSEANLDVTVISLGHSATALIPNVLDFAYSSENELDIESETAVTLRFLARYFQMFLLNEKILEFVRKDISLDNVATYVSYCNVFHDNKIATIAATLCAQSIHEIGEDSVLLCNIDPQFFVRVVSSNEINREASSCHLSILIAKYHKLHSLDESVLESLVGESQIPNIDCASALKLLQIVDKLENGNSEVFNNLCSRCMRVLRVNWKSFRELHRGEIFSVLRGLNSGLVTDLFDNIERDYHTEHYNTMSMQSKLVKRYRKQLSDEQQQRTEEVSNLKKEMDETVAELMNKNSYLADQLNRHADASNRRSVRSSSAYRSRIPSPKTNLTVKTQPASPSTPSRIPNLHTSQLSVSPSLPPRTPSSNRGFSSPRDTPGFSSPRDTRAVAIPRDNSKDNGIANNHGGIPPIPRSSTGTPRASYSSKIPTPNGAKLATPNKQSPRPSQEESSFTSFFGSNSTPRTNYATKIPTPNSVKMAASPKPSPKSSQEESSFSAFFGFVGFSDYLKSATSTSRTSDGGTIRSAMTFG